MGLPCDLGKDFAQASWEGPVCVKGHVEHSECIHWCPLDLCTKTNVPVSAKVTATELWAAAGAG